MSKYMPGMLTKDKETQGIEQPSVNMEHVNTSGTVKQINVLSPIQSWHSDTAMHNALRDGSIKSRFSVIS